MLTVKGTKTHLVEFSDVHLKDSRYHDWLRDLDTVLDIDRMEYLLPSKPDLLEEYVRNLQESEQEAFFAIHCAEDDAFVGTVRLAYIDWKRGTGHVGIMIGDKSYRGKGLATDAVHTLANYAFTYLNLRKLVTYPLESNVAMCKCFERVGFQKEGQLRKETLKMGQYYDSIYYGLFRDELQDLS